MMDEWRVEERMEQSAGTLAVQWANGTSVPSRTAQPCQRRTVAGWCSRFQSVARSRIVEPVSLIGSDRGE